MEQITNIKEVQSLALQILCYVDRVCRENNIKYALAGGTLLGAVRHKGFIPWDDDIDIIMPRPDYEKFLKIMDNTNSNNFKCLHYGENFPNYFYRFAKVVDLSTSLREAEYIQNPDLGVFVDVFPVDGIDINKAEKILNKSRKYSTLLMFSANKKYTKSPHGFLRSILKFFVFCHSKLFGWKFWLKKHENYVKNFKFEDYEFSMPYAGANGKRDVLEKHYFNEIIELEFESHKFCAFKEYDKYLTHVYGNYMQLPPKEKQVTHHEFKIYKK